MAKKASQKILRVGIIQNDTVLEERLIRKRETVTIGATPRSTFIVPLPTLGRPFPLLGVQSGQYHLAVCKGMRGRISTGGELYRFSDEIQGPGVQRRGNVSLIPLAEDSRGKVRIQDITVLFQFVDPPPTLPKPQLPASARGSFWNQIDYFLCTILVVSVLIQAGGIGALEFWWRNYGQYEQETFRAQRKKRVYESLVEEVRVERMKEETEPEKVADEGEGDSTNTDEVADAEPKPEVTPKPKASPRRTDSTSSGASRIHATREARVARVRGNTLLRYLGSEGGGDSAIGKNTLRGGVASEDLAKAWEAGKGVKVAGPEERRTYVGGPKAVAGTGDGEGGSYAGISGKDMGPKGRIKARRRVDTGRKIAERKISLRVGGDLGKQAGIGKIDRGSVASIFRRRMSAIKFCYQRVLQKDPTAEGKLTIQFTIGPAGRVTAIKVLNNDTGNQSLGQCIVGKVRQWRFPKPDQGSVTFVYPFILKKG